MFKLTLAVIVLAIAAVLVLAAMKPDTFRVQRTASIKAPPEKIYPLIANLRDNARWSPYWRRNPTMKSTYSGPDSGPGAQVDFDGDRNVGSGRVTITEVAPPNKVTMRLQMLKPFAADNVVEFTLAPRGDTTDVSWSMQGQRPYMIKIMSVFFNMDRMVGNDFAEGLANLKALVET
ncbi:MAG: SRPBCC family protein [Stenotrophobium sp.]